MNNRPECPLLCDAPPTATLFPSSYRGAVIMGEISPRTHTQGEIRPYCIRSYYGYDIITVMILLIEDLLQQ